jgi:hypothetical protein
MARAMRVGHGSSILALTNSLAKLGTTQLRRKKKAPASVISTILG